MTLWTDGAVAAAVQQRPADDEIPDFIGTDREAARLVRNETHRRVLCDPVAHAVFTLLRRVARAPEAERHLTLLDATAGILSFIDPADQRGYDRAVANYQTGLALAFTTKDSV